MNAIQQKCRPRHQVLVLKCYPRTTKGAVDVKPNSSELSYLLYYAASRRSKFQKVGSFLEKKTASDVWRLRIGNVQVTLQILEALIEKNPKDLPLFAPSVLKILDLILKSNDISMVESSTPTFEAFCANHDASSLFADQAYLKQYESIVRQYAALASTRSSPGKTQPSKPVAMRWRNTGLEAIRSVASSDALTSVSGRQYDIIVPMILENLWTDNEDFLEVLQQRAHVEEKVDTEKLLKRRTSVATVRTADTGDVNPIALSGSAMDVDKLAEEDIGVLAMLCLKQIFIAPNRAQIHAATVALLSFIEERVNQEERVVKTNSGTGRDGGWAIKMFGLISRWAPVQERYVILVTAMDTLVRTPLSDETLQQHIVLVAMIGALLRSEVNLIGLSVMDVLMSLMQHMKRLVQLPGEPIGTRGSDALLPGQPDPRSPNTIAAATAAELTASFRKELLGRLQQTIGDLATHVYYADQISDMISAILSRLKPSRSNSPASSSPQGENADGQGGGASVANSTMAEDSHLESLFALTVAKTAALKAIKSILLVANPRTKMSGNMGLARNKVPIRVWEGTQWLLRDPDGQVRKAYADALLTWLDRETTKADLKARDENAPSFRASMRGSSGHHHHHQQQQQQQQQSAMAFAIAKRAASSASNRKEPKLPRSHFLNLIHVAIYDNALQFVDYETDMVLLHVLLARLVGQLGINAVRYGLGMIFRLQEDIQDVDPPLAKVRIGSLVHGYFWALTEKFDFEASVVGRAIHNEIIRRRSKHFWVEGMHIPPPLLELVGTPGMARPQPKMPLHRIETEALLPFDDRLALVDAICTGYQEGAGWATSPPQSPAASPGRTFSHPILSSAMGGGVQQSSAVAGSDSDRDVPARFREQMYVDWTREAVLAAVQAGSKSASLSGSRAGTTGTSGGGGNRNVSNGNNRLTVNGGGSPYGSQRDLRPSSQPVFGPGGGGANGNNNGPNLAAPMGMGAASKLRKSSLRSNLTPSPVSSTMPRGGVTSVDQLKMVLSGQVPASSLQAGLGGDGDDSSDSLVSYDMTPSEASFNPAGSSAAPGPAGPAPSQQQRRRNSAGPRSRSRSQSRERKASLGAESLGGARPSGGASDPPPHHPPSAPAAIMAGGPGGLGGPLNSNPPVPRVSQDGVGPSTVPPVPPLPSGIAVQDMAAGAGAGPTRLSAPPPAQPRPSSSAAVQGGGRGGQQPRGGPSPPLQLPSVAQENSAIRPAKTRGGGPKSRGGTSAGGGGSSPPPPFFGGGVREGRGAARPVTAPAPGYGAAASGVSAPPTMDLTSLLTRIDSRAGEVGLGNVTRPPY